MKQLSARKKEEKTTGTSTPTLPTHTNRQMTAHKRNKADEKHESGSSSKGQVVLKRNKDTKKVLKKDM